jgi:hypothetical protein
MTAADIVFIVWQSLIGLFVVLVGVAAFCYITAPQAEKDKWSRQLRLSDQELIRWYDNNH